MLFKKLISKKLKISIVGLGYVGLPLALLFGRKFCTYGIDKSTNKIKNLKKFYDQNNQFKKKNFKNSKYINFTSS